MHIIKKSQGGCTCCWLTFVNGLSLYVFKVAAHKVTHFMFLETKSFKENTCKDYILMSFSLDLNVMDISMIALYYVLLETRSSRLRIFLNK
jgi:hypothetical protein